MERESKRASGRWRARYKGMRAEGRREKGEGNEKREGGSGSSIQKMVLDCFWGKNTILGTFMFIISSTEVVAKSYCI